MNIFNLTKEPWAPMEIRIEGGGVNFGLLPLEAGHLLGADQNQTCVALMLTMIIKGIIYLNDNNVIMLQKSVIKILKNDSLNDFSKRILISKALKTLVTEFEYMFIQIIFPSKSIQFEDLDTSLIFYDLEKALNHKMIGYSKEETIIYYSDLIEFIDNGGWVDGTIEKTNWEIIKKTLNLDPELGIKEMLQEKMQLRV